MHYPRHIGIIPDGNRTRAAEQGFPKIQGHLAGFNNAIALVKRTFSQTPIEVFTLRGLSTENTTNRPQDELDYLFEIYKRITDELHDFLVEQQVNLRRVGKAEGLPDDLVLFMQRKQQELSFPESERHLCIAINYGGRDEIIRGVQDWYTKGDTSVPLTEEVLSTHMDFGDLPPIELVIRTKGGEAKRLSGFMLRWIAYAELYFTDLYFPALIPAELEKALLWFSSIAEKRNFGK